MKREARLLHPAARLFVRAAVDACPGTLASTLPFRRIRAQMASALQVQRAGAHSIHITELTRASQGSYFGLSYTVSILNFFTEPPKKQNKALSSPELQVIFGKCDGGSDLPFPDNQSRTLCSLTVAEWTAEVTRSAPPSPCCAFGPYMGEVECDGEMEGFCPLALLQKRWSVALLTQRWTERPFWTNLNKHLV